VEHVFGQFARKARDLALSGAFKLDLHLAHKTHFNLDFLFSFSIGFPSICAPLPKAKGKKDPKREQLRSREESAPSLSCN